MFLMNEAPLPVPRFLNFDLLPLGFNEQGLSRKIRRISVHLCPEERGGEVPTCVCAHVHSGVQIYVQVYVCTHVYSFMCTCERVLTRARRPF